ncbi:ABC transporter permease [Azospirillum sp. B2RO_4]|uniref:ABC transporter permease n=1 Tax=Azospirillum sp. B2RO_4 TaxID=3027796 RepID=UPI003DA81E67
MLELLSFGPNGWGGQLLLGTAMTVAVAVSAFAFGILIGSLGASAKLSHSLALNTVADIYTTVVRGVPELLVIYLLFFGGNSMATAIAAVFGYGGRVELDAFVIGMLSVGLISGAYSTEVIRGAVRSVPFGQIEAARACGMSRWLILRRVLVPQTMRFALPGLGNVWQLTLKDTALVSVTSLAELMRVSRLAGSATRDYFLFYGAAAVLYLLLTTISTALFSRAEQVANRGVRRA